MRVYELAKQLNVDSKIILNVLQHLDIDARNHMSTMDEATTQLVTDIIEGRVPLERKDKPKPKAPRPKPVTRVVSAPPPPEPKVVAVGPQRGKGRREERPEEHGKEPAKQWELAPGAAVRPVFRQAVTPPAPPVPPGVTRPLPGAVARPGPGPAARPAAAAPAAARPAPAAPEGRAEAPPRPGEGQPAAQAPGAAVARAGEPARPGVETPAAAVRPAKAPEAAEARVAAAPAQGRVAPAETVSRSAEARVAPADAAAGPADARVAGAETAAPRAEAARVETATRPAEARVAPAETGARPAEAPQRPQAPAVRPVAPTWRQGAGTPVRQREEDRRGFERPPESRPGGWGRPAGAPGRPGAGAGRPGPGPGRPGAGPGRPGGGRPAPGGRPGTGMRPGWRAAPPSPMAPPKPAAKPGKKAPPRRVEPWEHEEEEEGVRRLARYHRPAPARVERKPVVAKKVTILGPLTVKELAEKLNVPAADVIKKLLEMGVLATINQELDRETAMIVASEFGAEVKEPEVTQEQLLVEDREETEGEDEALLRPRPPVVTVMGHVDHGKTSLLDAIRHTRVTDQEAGGITQHIGAYTVEWNGRQVVFIDTPGHEAFTAMRARGAKVTDIAVLVVAADDGVMPQTVEAISHARAAGVPIVVAINKIDRADARPDRVKQQLSEHGLIPEDWGGDVVMVPVSARTGENLDRLLEMILLVADLQDLKANPDRPARGTIIEAKLDRGRGPVGTVIVQAGTLRTGDVFVAGLTWGKVRAMTDDRGRQVKEAGPSMPVEVIGFEEVPLAGDILRVVPDEHVARSVAEQRQLRHRAEEQQTRRVGLEDFMRQARAGEVQELRLIIKADVQGSVEALRQALQKLEHPEVRVVILHEGVGAISESDIMLASASGAIVVGFNVRPDVNARRAAEQEGVEVRTYRIIYELLDDVRAAMRGLLKPTLREIPLGRAQVRATFHVPKVGNVAGCYVTEGKVVRGAQVRVVRDGTVVHESRIDSLKRFKEDVREVPAGMECGIFIERFQDVKEGDELEVYTVEEVRPEL
ncbi:MAG: translation initiation factor IF-2 [Bacillota bacterium]